MSAACLWPAKATLGEGPLWDSASGLLWWVDIAGEVLHCCTPDQSVRRTLNPGSMVSSFGLARDGRLIAATARGFAFVGPGNGALDVFAPAPFDAGTHRFNDSKVDRRGAFWSGSLEKSERTASGALFRLTADLAVRKIDDGFLVPNGPAFSADGRAMFLADSARRTLYRYALDAEGLPVERTTLRVFEKAEGYPDGMTVDAAGRLWVAFWDGHCVRCLDPGDGTTHIEIALPIGRPTSCMFGGVDLKTLFITSARIGGDESAEDAGGIFAITCDVAGIAEPLFH